MCVPIYHIFKIKGANYSEFQSFVKCSQMEPVNRKELQQLFVPTNKTTYAASSSLSRKQEKTTTCSIFNNNSQIGKSQEDQTKTKTKKNSRETSSSFRKPKKASEFETLWLMNGILNSNSNSKSNDSSDYERKADYFLTKINKKKFIKWYSNFDINISILKDIIEILHSHSEGEQHHNNNSMHDLQNVYLWMVAITKISRFSIHFMCLESKHKDMIKSIFMNILKEKKSSSLSVDSVDDEEEEESIGDCMRLYGLDIKMMNK